MAQQKATTTASDLGGIPRAATQPAGRSQGAEPAAMAQREAGCLVRLAWMVVGNVVLVLSLICVARHRGSFLSVGDAAYWTAAAGSMAIRYVDITRFGGRTVTGEPATIRHWRRYAAVLLPAALVAWGAAHAIAWFAAKA